MSVNLDHFKKISDSLGHTIGDQLLKAVSRCLSNCVCEEDTLVRLGGDEFTILLEDIDKMAVNLSGHQLLGNRLVDNVSQALEHTGCQAEWLELEITEGFLICSSGDLIQQPEQSCASLQTLRDIGMQIAIDDLGTGYSSLSYLKGVPIQQTQDRLLIRARHPVRHQ